MVLVGLAVESWLRLRRDGDLGGFAGRGRFWPSSGEKRLLFGCGVAQAQKSCCDIDMYKKQRQTQRKSTLTVGRPALQGCLT